MNSKRWNNTPTTSNRLYSTNRLNTVRIYHPKPSPNIKFSTVYFEWVDHHGLEVEKATVYRYKKEYTKIGAYFGDMYIKDITTDMIQDFIKLLLLDLSRTTVNKYAQNLKLCFRYAISQGYLNEDNNPMDGVAIPKRQRVEIHPFSPQEINIILQQDASEWVRDGIIIAYRTGMRLGEIFAIIPSIDINFDEQYISVQRSQCRVGSKVFLKTTKTPSGVRRIDIDTYLALHLLSMVEKHPDSKFLFPDPNDPNLPRIPWNISTYLRQMCRDAGVPERNFHTLRHTHASVLLAHGTHPKIVQERLGHADVSTTLTTYSHLTPTIQKQAVNVFEDL